ncbi:MAG: hypothetical protein WAZ18_01045 [Alphaproteobacteria bacterium]
MTIQNMERRAFLTGVGALGASALVPPAALARDRQVDCALVTGLDASGSFGPPMILEQTNAVCQALSSLHVQRRMKENGICMFDFFIWSSEGVDHPGYVDVVRGYKIRPYSVASDIKILQDILVASYVGIVEDRIKMPASTDTAFAIRHARELGERYEIPSGGICALNIVTDDDVSRVGNAPMKESEIAIRKGMTVNAMVVGKDIRYAQTQIQAGNFSFAMSQNYIGNMVDAWELKLARDLG